MSVIGIEIPQLNEEQDIEVEVRINGIKKQYNYRVEIFYWDQCDAPPEDRVACIRSMINGYSAEWDLAHLGMPTDDYIPITFRKKRT